MAKGEDAVRRKKSKTIRKKNNRSSSSLAAKVSAKKGKRRRCQEEYIRPRDEAHACAEEESASSQGQHSLTSDNSFFMEVVRGKNKKGHVYGLGELGDEFLASSPLQSDTPALDLEQVGEMIETITKLNSKLAAMEARFRLMEARLDELTRRGQQHAVMIEQIFRHLNMRPPFVSPPPSSSDTDESDSSSGLQP